MICSNCSGLNATMVLKVSVMSGKATISLGRQLSDWQNSSKQLSVFSDTNSSLHKRMAFLSKYIRASNPSFMLMEVDTQTRSL